MGITSWGAGPGPNWYVSAAHAVPWIHKVLKEEGYENIDITPCYEDDGTWAPSTECGGFALDPGTAYGSYSEQCAVGAPLSGPSSICGKANPKAKGGAKLPEVRILAPKAEQEFSQGEGVFVEVEVGNVNKGATSEVTLLLSGDEQDTLKKKPYRWKLSNLARGEHGTGGKDRPTQRRQLK